MRAKDICVMGMTANEAERHAWITGDKALHTLSIKAMESEGKYDESEVELAKLNDEHAEEVARNERLTEALEVHVEAWKYLARVLSNPNFPIKRPTLAQLREFGKRVEALVSDGMSTTEALMQDAIDACFEEVE